MVGRSLFEGVVSFLAWVVTDDFNITFDLLFIKDDIIYSSILEKPFKAQK